MKIGAALTGPRLYLRDHRPSDLDFSAGMWLDEENGRYLSDPTWDYVDAPFQKALDTLQDSGAGYYLTACLSGTEERVGTCCLFPAIASIRAAGGRALAGKSWNWLSAGPAPKAANG